MHTDIHRCRKTNTDAERQTQMQKEKHRCINTDRHKRRETERQTQTDAILGLQLS